MDIKAVYLSIFLSVLTACTSTKMKSEPNSTNPIQNEIFLLAEFVTKETQVKPLPEKMKLKLLDALSAYPSLKQSKLDLYGQN